MSLFDFMFKPVEQITDYICPACCGKGYAIFDEDGNYQSDSDTQKCFYCKGTGNY